VPSAAPIPAQVANPQQVVVPTPAPTAVALTATAPVTPEPPKGEPNVLESMPEKFRDKDVQSSITKMSKSYGDLEAELKKERDEKANMQRILDSLSTPKPPIMQPPQVPQEEEIEDSAFFEKPRETVMKVAERIAAQKILQYHADMEKAKFIDGFRTTHADFDQLRGEILEVLSARPDLDRDQRNLPIVYEMAKQLKVKKINDLRASLGLGSPNPIYNTQQPQAVQEPIDREKIKEELMEAIRVEIQKRRSASGIQGGSAPINPDSRLNPAPAVKPMTPEEQILSEMMNSGPKKLAIDLG